MRRNDDDSCERPRCRRECTLMYLGTRLCQRHWIRLCGQQDGDERATESQAPCPGHLDMPLTTCVSAHSATYLEEGPRSGKARLRGRRDPSEGGPRAGISRSPSVCRTSGRLESVGLLRLTAVRGEICGVLWGEAPPLGQIDLMTATWTDNRLVGHSGHLSANGKSRSATSPSIPAFAANRGPALPRIDECAASNLYSPSAWAQGVSRRWSAAPTDGRAHDRDTTDTGIRRRH